MNLSTARANLTLGVSLMVLIVLAGWFLLVGPTVSKVGETRTQVTDTADSNLLLTNQLGSLRAQAEDLTVTRSAATTLEQMWPGTADQPGFFRAVNAAAASAGYADGDITTLSPGAPVTVAAGADVASVASGTAPVAPVAPDPATVGAEGADATSEPVVSEPTLAVQTLTLTAEGSYDQARELLEQLEELPRSVLLLTVDLQAGQEGALTLNVTGATFVASPMRAPREVTTTAQATTADQDGAEGPAEVADGAP